jgi:hypothetical protein
VERANPGGDPRRHLGSGFEDEAERGVLSADDYWRGFGERMHYPLSAAQWVEARQVAMEPDGALLALVRLLRVARPVGMFTNNPWLLQRHIGEVFPAVLELFGTHAVFSAELGRSKPDPEAFRHLATRLLGYPTSPDTCSVTSGRRPSGSPPLGCSAWMASRSAAARPMARSWSIWNGGSRWRSWRNTRPSPW